MSSTDSHQGPKGEARRLPAERLEPFLTGEVQATLDYWWLHLPGTAMMIAHSEEDSATIQSVQTLQIIMPSPDNAVDTLDTFAIGLITLGDIPGVRPANRRWPWVTHELLVHTIDTSNGPVPFETPFPWRFMEPPNLSVQFQVDNDDQARQLLSEVVKGIVDGVLPPEVQAYVPAQKKMMTILPLYNLWQDTVNATAEHMRGEH